MKIYRVQEFANLAGVTVRALHHYDEIGLLQPTRRTDAGHRHYTEGDLLRLQQIVTLQHIGFSLEEIGTLLQSYDLRHSLKAQHAALTAEIARLQQAADALAATLEAVEATGEADPALVITLLHTLAVDDGWARQFYTQEAWAKVEQNRITSTEAIQGAQQWAQVMAGFREACHLPPSHPDVQALAAQMHELVEAFTGGDAQVEAGLREMYTHREDMPAMYRVDDDLHAFMNNALEIYKEQNHHDNN